jgi:hypothetical protein
MEVKMEGRLVIVAKVKRSGPKSNQTIELSDVIILSGRLPRGDKWMHITIEEKEPQLPERKGARRRKERKLPEFAARKAAERMF